MNFQKDSGILTPDLLRKMTDECDKFVIKLHYEYQQYKETLKSLQCQNQFQPQPQQQSAPYQQIVQPTSNMIQFQQTQQIPLMQQQQQQYPQSDQYYQQAFQQAFYQMAQNFANSSTVSGSQSTSQSQQQLIQVNNPEVSQYLQTPLIKNETYNYYPSQAYPLQPQYPIQSAFTQVPYQIQTPTAIPQKQTVQPQESKPRRTHKPQQSLKETGRRWNGYLVFCLYCRKEIQKEFPKMNNQEQTKLIAEKWKALSENDKGRWKEEATKLNEIDVQKFQYAQNQALAKQKLQDAANEGATDSRRETEQVEESASGSAVMQTFPMDGNNEIQGQYNQRIIFQELDEVDGEGNLDEDDDDNEGTQNNLDLIIDQN